MKKIYFGILGIVCGLGATAQNARVVQSSKNVEFSINQNTQGQKVLTPTDTLWGWLMNGGTPALYLSQGGGYVVGSNAYNDYEKSEKFVVTTPYSVEGCIFIVGGLQGAPTSTDAITTQMYNLDDVAASVNFGSTYPAPGTVIAGSNVDVLVSTIDTSSTGAQGIVYVSLPSPVSVTTDYAYGVDFSANYNNAGLYVGLVSSTKGDGGGAEMCFEKWSDATKHTILEGWGATSNIDVDLAIFPIVNMVTGINELSYVHGMSVSKPTPNPVKSTSILNFDLQKNVQDLTIAILDISGKKVKVEDLKGMNAGAHQYAVDASSLTNGTYIIMLTADGKSLAAKFEVAK